MAANSLPPAAPGPFAKAAAVLLGAVLLVAGFMFSVVLLAVAAVVGVLVFGYFWWKTRALRQALREEMKKYPPHGPARSPGSAGEAATGAVFEGEAVVVEREPGIVASSLSDKSSQSPPASAPESRSPR